MVQLQKINPQLEELGYQILAISPDPPEQLVRTAARRGIDLALLGDPDLGLSRALGIAFHAPGSSPLPVPAVYIAGTDRVVDFQYVNPKYSVRLDPAVLLAAARAALGE